VSLTHRDLAIKATEWLLKQSWCDVACFELKVGRGFADAIGISKPRAKKARVTIVEVKRTRSDLLADLRAKKYMKYEPQSTHCYIAGTAEAYGNRTRAQTLVDLKMREVPDHWGILEFGPRGGITCHRPAKAHRRTTSTRVKALTRKIAKSLIYRALQGRI